MTEEKCYKVTDDRTLDQNYWNKQYQLHATGWDLGEVAPPLKSYIDTIINKNSAVLIPGCGNAYEAEYLLQQGFTNITIIDIAPKLVENLKNIFVNNKYITVILGDFFEHQGVYDLIIEQTFFCALPPFMRQKYVWKMHQILASKGFLSGLLFNRVFEVSPPFGGNLEEYKALFQQAFRFKSIHSAQNSIPKRQDSELFFEFQKNNSVKVNLYHFKGITCSDGKNEVTEKFLEMEGIKNVSINADFSQILITSNHEIASEELQQTISYDGSYKIIKI